MKKLLNTLYVTSEDSYLSLDGENVVIFNQTQEMGRIPLHNLEAIVSFGYRGASPALMGGCAGRNISLCFLTPQGKFLARITGSVKGNVILRKRQYEASIDSDISLGIARNCILGKVYNSRWVLERATRDHGLQVDVEQMKRASGFLKDSLGYIETCTDMAQLRGYEGEAASVYFGVFNQMILQQKKDFAFSGRNKRPPLDNVNAMLSFVYTLLTGMVASALETVGLDPYVGFMHADRPGRVSLALDLIEELRPVLADRFVLALINRKMITGKDFTKKEDGAVLMSDKARKNLLTEWQNRKKDVITHPYLGEGGVGDDTICSGYADGQVLERRYRRISAVFLEVGGYMLILITYDVNTETAAGKTRLRKVAKQCVNYGTRVQNSVFECILDPGQCLMLKSVLTDIIDESVDSLRFYYLGNQNKAKVEQIGVGKGIKVDGPLIF